MKSKFQSNITVLRNEATEGDNGGGTTPEVTNAIEFPTEPLLAPTAYVALEESPNITAEVIRIGAQVNHNGKPFIKLTLQMDTGRTSHDMFVTAGAAANTFRQLKKAFGFEPSTNPDKEEAAKETAEALQLIVGKKCSLSTGPDEFNGVTRNKIRFVNRYNEFANDTVDLGAIFAAAAAAPSIDISEAAF